MCRESLVHLPSFVSGKPYQVSATPRFFATSALDFDFSLDVPSPDNWYRFLEQLWCDDPESIATLQEWFGYPGRLAQHIFLRSTKHET